MLIIEKPSVERVLETTMESGLGLDISKRSTGIAIYDGNKIETYQSVIEFDEESNLSYYYMVESLEEDLLSLIDGKHFDVIGIEDVIESVNFETLRDLILLNSVIDKLIARGRVTCNYFRRINNSVWKKWLRSLRPGKFYETDKVEIENILDYLNYPLVDEYRDVSKARKDKEGYQDQLDAVGLLVGVGLERMNSKETPVKRKKHYKIHVELYESVEEVLKKYEVEELNQIKLSGDLLSSTRKFFKDLNKDDKLRKFYMVVDTLGTLGVEYDISDLPSGKNHLVVYQTSNK